MISCRSPHSSQPLCTEKAKQLIIRFLWIKQTFSGEPGSFLIYFIFFFSKETAWWTWTFPLSWFSGTALSVKSFLTRVKPTEGKDFAIYRRGVQGEVGKQKKNNKTKNKKRTNQKKKEKEKKESHLLFYCCMKKRKTFHVNLWRWPQRGQQLPPCTVRPAGRGSTASEWMKENKIVSDLFKKSVKQITDSFFF